MAELEVRDAIPGDLPPVGAAWLQLQEYHRSLGLAFDLPPDAAEKWLDSFQRTLGRFSFLWVIGPPGKINAFVLARVKQSPAYLGSVQVGEISELYVDDSLRGSGAGKLLAETALNKFRELKVHSVEVQVQSGNHGGLAFWLRQGLQQDLTLVRKIMKD
jgi:L-amino acid N-acyltransferase YncA